MVCESLPVQLSSTYVKLVRRESVKQLSIKPLNLFKHGKSWQHPCIGIRHMKKLVNGGGGEEVDKNRCNVDSCHNLTTISWLAYSLALSTRTDQSLSWVHNHSDGLSRHKHLGDSAKQNSPAPTHPTACLCVYVRVILFSQPTHSVGPGVNADGRALVTAAIVVGAGVDGKAMDAVIAVTLRAATVIGARTREHTLPLATHLAAGLLVCQTPVDGCRKREGYNNGGQCMKKRHFSVVSVLCCFMRERAYTHTHAGKRTHVLTHTHTLTLAH